MTKRPGRNSGQMVADRYSVTPLPSDPVMRKTVAKLLDRKLAAHQAFAETLLHFGAPDLATAERVATYYIRQRVARYDGHAYKVTHGAFLDRDVVLRAVAAVEAGKG